MPWTLNLIALEYIAKLLDVITNFTVIEKQRKVFGDSLKTRLENKQMFKQLNKFGLYL